LQRKTGEVLRVMDRGVTSINSVLRLAYQKPVFGLSSVLGQPVPGLHQNTYHIQSLNLFSEITIFS